MWSDPTSTHQNGDAIAEDLHATVAAAGEKAPFVLMGHSMGRSYATIYRAPRPLAGAAQAASRCASAPRT